MKNGTIIEKFSHLPPPEKPKTRRRKKTNKPKQPPKPKTPEQANKTKQPKTKPHCAQEENTCFSAVLI